VKRSPEQFLPAAIVAERDWVAGRPYFKPEQRPLIERLCNATIWNRLNRRSPVIARVKLIREWSESHPEKAPDGERSDRELALQMAFRGAFYLAISNMRTYTPAEDREWVSFYRKKALQFQQEASWVRDLSEEAAEHARALAEWYEAVTAELDSGATHPSLVVGRHQKPPHMRAFCVLLGGIMRRLYGHVLRETVASIATAAFNKAVSKEDVGYWCK
jgi:hypothetical protein